MSNPIFNAMKSNEANNIRVLIKLMEMQSPNRLMRKFAWNSINLHRSFLSSQTGTQMKGGKIRKWT